MVMIQYTASQEPAKKKPKAISTPFYYGEDKDSPYLKEGKPMLWSQVVTEVAGIMKSRGIGYASNAEFARRLPQLIFGLENELEELQAKATKPKK